MRQVIYVLSTDNPMPAVFAAAMAQGKIRPVRQDRLSAGEIAGAAGLIACVGLDQVGMMEHRQAVEAMLDAGGGTVFCGHVLRPFVDRLELFVPLTGNRRSDYVLTRLADHPVFAGIDAKTLEANRGVAGFYGRGHNPPPSGATVLTGLGPDLAPVDWVWHRPAGGALFVHSGNDLWGVGDDPAVKAQIAHRLVSWCLEGGRREMAA